MPANAHRAAGPHKGPAVFVYTGAYPGENMTVDVNTWLKGITIGLAIAAPVGPIGVLCIRRTLANGMATGFASGLGAATADAFYGFVAAFGLTFISALLVS